MHTEKMQADRKKVGNEVGSRGLNCKKAKMPGYDKNGGPFSGIDVKELVNGPRRTLLELCNELVKKKCITTRTEFVKFAPQEVVKKFRRDSSLWDGVGLSAYARKGQRKEEGAPKEKFAPLPPDAYAFLSDAGVLEEDFPCASGAGAETHEEEEEEDSAFEVSARIHRRPTTPPEPVYMCKKWEDANAQEREKIASVIFRAAVSGSPADVARMLGKGIPLDVKDEFGRPFFIFVAERGQDFVMGELIERMKCLDKRDKNGDTMLIAASEAGQARIVRKLLGINGAKKPDIDAVNGQGMSALMLASWEGHADVVKALLDAGAKPGMRDKNGFTALNHAKEEGHAEIAELLRRKQK